jgi:C1A family cysteine protease
MRIIWVVLGLGCLTGLLIGALYSKEEPETSSMLLKLNVEEQATFKEWMQVHHKAYATDEQRSAAYTAFLDNKALIRVHNNSGLRSKIGPNHLADLSYSDFTKLFVHCTVTPLPHEDLSTDNLPESVDWRVKGAVTVPGDDQLTNQGWSFSSAAALEGIRAISSGKLEALSKQQLTDCVNAATHCPLDKALAALKYASDFGLESEAAYSKGGRCDRPAAAKAQGFKAVKSRDQLQLKAAVAKQPVIALVQADQSYFHLHESGTITENCGRKVNHAVLIVGYGIDENGTPYWLIKNSWGVSWGDGGYGQIYRTDATDEEGMCGIAIQAFYPVY